MKKYLLNKAIALAKKNKLIQSLFEKPIDVSKLKQKGKFTDGLGNEHILYEGYRSLIRPNWENVLNLDKSVVGTKVDFRKIKENGKLQVERFMPIIKAYKSNLSYLSVLELGCHLGAVCFSLAEHGIAEVVGSDFSGYKKDSTNNSLNINQINAELKESRNSIGAYCSSESKKRIRFVDDDITNSNLEDESFDVILSFDVLEHLSNPKQAFVNVERILKKGGIAIYEYNPFFALNGGHSLCTLDFPWGHVRLNSVDFEKYLDEVRPNEKSLALSFYKFGINRLTISEVKKLTESAGLKTEAIFTYSKEQHVRMLTEDIIEQAKIVYPYANAEDLVSPRIVLIQRKE